MEGQRDLNLKTISPHFTEEILRAAVEKCYQKKTGRPAPKIMKCCVNIGSGKGDGYIGVLYRIHVTLEQNIVVNMIGKGMPSNVARRKTFHCDSFFANEIFFYNKVVPAFLEFEKQKLGAKYEQSFLAIPDCYYAMSDGIDDFLILEDLKEDGYDNADRSVALKTELLTEMFLLFARFHAFSLAMKHVHPEKFREISDRAIEPSFHRVDGMWTERRCVANLAKHYIAAVKTELENTKYLERFIHFTAPENFYPKMFYTVETKPDKSVINHGDTWITNFMFRDSAIKAIDFQLIRYCSPILDLSTIVFACTDSVQREALGGIDGILSLYQSELNRVVTSLGAPEDAGMSLDEVRSAWREFGAFGFGFSILLVQLSLIEEDDVKDLDRFEGDQALTLADITPFAEIKSAEGKKRLVDLLKCAVDTGVI